MGVKPAQVKLNAALKQIFACILNVYLIHDDLIIGAKTFNKHNLALEEVMKATDQANLTVKNVLLEKRKLYFGEWFSHQAVWDQTSKKLKLWKTSLHLKIEVN